LFEAIYFWSILDRRRRTRLTPISMLNAAMSDIADDFGGHPQPEPQKCLE
jgi:hypothetical protein